MLVGNNYATLSYPFHLSPISSFSCCFDLKAPPSLNPTLSRSPTPDPVASPTNQPNAPTPGCCSQNFQECIGWCGTTQASCISCGQDVFWINGRQAECLARWSDCTNDQSGCCDGLLCEEQSQYYAQCVVDDLLLSNT